MKKDKTVYMCMSCGNCKRTDSGSDAFKFSCNCGGFPIDGIFAAKIETIGCRSWIPADDNYWEPYVFTVDEKHKKIQIGKFGREFADVDEDEFYMIGDNADSENEDTFNRIIDFCKDRCVD